MNNGERNYFINAVLFIAGFVVIFTGITQHLRLEWVYTLISAGYVKQMHIWIGYALAAILVVHLILHSKWISALTEKVFASPKKALAFTSLIVVCIIACYLAGALAPQSEFGGRMGPGQGGVPPTFNYQGGGPNGYGPPNSNNQQ